MTVNVEFQLTCSTHMDFYLFIVIPIVVHSQHRQFLLHVFYDILI